MALGYRQTLPFSRIRHTARRRKLYCSLSTQSGRGVAGLTQLGQRLGLYSLAVFDGSVSCVRAYPQYRGFRFSGSLLFSNYTGRTVTLRNLCLFTQAHPGVTLILATSRGFLPHQRCLALGVGGILAGVVRLA